MTNVENFSPKDAQYWEEKYVIFHGFDHKPSQVHPLQSERIDSLVRKKNAKQIID
jgi:hypothetical protein